MREQKSTNVASSVHCLIWQPPIQYCRERCREDADQLFHNFALLICTIRRKIQSGRARRMEINSEAHYQSVIYRTRQSIDGNEMICRNLIKDFTSYWLLSYKFYCRTIRTCEERNSQENIFTIWSINALPKGKYFSVSLSNNQISVQAVKIF